MGKKSSVFKSTFLTLIGITFFCLTDVSHAQLKGEDIVIGKQRKIYSNILNEERSLLIHVPTSYEKSQRKYPVLYVLDGGQIFTFSKVTGTVERMAFGVIPNMIIVGIKNTDRERDMFPMKTKDDPTSGSAENFQKFISEELIPFVDRNYRTESFRILNGTSNSAFFTIYVLLENPNLFSAYIASSPTLLGWFENRLSKKFDERKNKNEAFNKILYLIYGENDFPSILEAIPGFTSIVEEKVPKGFMWEVKSVDDEGHVPYNGLYEGLKFVFSDWRYPSNKLRESTFQDVKAHYNLLSKKYGYNVDIPPIVLVDLGNAMVRVEKINEALEVLIYNVRLYPSNPMSHFYLGLAYEKNGDTASAVEHIGKAVELDPSWARAKKKLAELTKM
jgi:predicted alpha/beta superfamily hydrolase